jgi:hypothetical protein
MGSTPDTKVIPSNPLATAQTDLIPLEITPAVLVNEPAGSATPLPGPPQISNLAALVHSERFAPFLSKSSGNVAEAMNLYAWNIEISAAFWGVYHMFEITYRNAIHQQLEVHTGISDWWNSSLRPKIHQSELDTIDRAIADASKNHANPQTLITAPAFTAGHIVAELSLGFWVILLANKYHASLWTGNLEKSFPLYTGKRNDLHKNLVRLTRLRNRIAHHEPVIDRDLNVDQMYLLAVINYIDPNVRQWVDLHSRVNSVLANKVNKLNGTLRSSF